MVKNCKETFYLLFCEIHYATFPVLSGIIVVNLSCLWISKFHYKGMPRPLQSRPFRVGIKSAKNWNLMRNQWSWTVPVLPIQPILLVLLFAMVIKTSFLKSCPIFTSLVWLFTTKGWKTISIKSIMITSLITTWIPTKFKKQSFQIKYHFSKYGETTTRVRIFNFKPVFIPNNNLFGNE